MRSTRKQITERQKQKPRWVALRTTLRAEVKAQNQTNYPRQRQQKILLKPQVQRARLDQHWYEARFIGARNTSKSAWQPVDPEIYIWKTDSPRMRSDNRYLFIGKPQGRDTAIDDSGNPWNIHDPRLDTILLINLFLGDLSRNMSMRITSETPLSN